jgi:phosphate transport system protein
MGSLVIDQVSKAVNALLVADKESAEAVLSREPLVNNFQKTIDHRTFEFIALHPLVAGDLRFTQGLTRATVEMERVGDESKKIARFALRLLNGEPHEPVVLVAQSLRHMAALGVDMLRMAVRALDESNLELAQQVIERDEELDREFEAAMRRVLTLVMEGEPYLRSTIDTVFALKGLERIGDHSKNIAEQVVFMIQG